MVEQRENGTVILSFKALSFLVFFFGIGELLRSARAVFLDGSCVLPKNNLNESEVSPGDGETEKIL